MEQFSENQYDDDLTVGANEFDDLSSTGAVDLFEFSAQEESPISRLKSLILSIDWEITDDILIEFNEELVDLQDVWAEEKVNLVYLQALGKISKYIYQQKVNSHPNAIKLLLILYYNLEKIVSSENLTVKQQQELLLEDVKRFENLKGQISQKAAIDTVLLDGDDESDSLAIEPKSENELLQLKATVLGIDWEITEQDLNDLRQEVNRLEEKYAESRPRLILLQGIGTLGAYIKAKKSNAHGDAFKLLHLFFESLEKIVKTPMDLEEEKAILFPAVDKFNSFKSLLGSLSSSDSDSDPEDRGDSGRSKRGGGDVQPAFANIPEESVRGFQENEEAGRLGPDRSADVVSHIDTFFGDDSEEGDIEQVAVDTQLEGDEGAEPDGVISQERELALLGVEVETEADDDTDEDELPVEESGKLAPALAFGDDEASTYSVDSLNDPSLVDDVGRQVTETLDEFFVDDQDNAEIVSKSEVDPDEHIDPVSADVAAEPQISEMEESVVEPPLALDRELAMQGVNVETEADDDSDQDELPVEESGKLAPALAFGDDEASTFSADSLDDPSLVEGVGKQVTETLDDFFVDDQDNVDIAPKSVVDPDEQIDPVSVDEAVEPQISEMEESVVEPLLALDRELAMQGVNVETEADDDSDEDELPVEESGRLAPALAFDDDEASTYSADSLDDTSLVEGVGKQVTETLDNFFVDEQQISGVDEVVAEVEQTEVLLDSSVEDKLPSDSIVAEEEQLDTLLNENGLADSFESFEEPEFVEEVAEDEIISEADQDFVALLGAQREGQVLGEDESELSATEADKVEDLEDPADEEVVFELVAAAGEDEEHDPMSVLGKYIDSIGSELDDELLGGLYSEIDLLNQKWAAHSLEKSFVQILATVVKYIDQNRFESDSESYGLLKSNYDALGSLEEGMAEQNQELLFNELSKALQWQQKLLIQQTGAKK